VKPLGARPLGDQLTEFRVWAPSARSIALRVGSSEVELQDAGNGFYEVVAPAATGDDYLFVVDDRPLPDPCSRWQPGGLRGPSRVFAPPATGDCRQFRRRPIGEHVIYELHVGAFSEAGTFGGAIPYLRELAHLGVTAIEIMPVAEFPGARGWGYDGVYLSAAQSSYGGPNGLAQLVDAAHSQGLSVILDVVYNHIGASGVDALRAFGPYFTDRDETLWGPAIDYERPEVRDWVLQSAAGWIRDFGIDGLRLDAIHSIFDPTDEHIVQAIARRVRAVSADALVVGEIGMDDPQQHGAPACDAIWVDDFHHALHVLLTGERDGYYKPFGHVAHLADVFRRRPSGHFVVYAQNHDQIGNRAFGDRLPRRLQPLAAFCTLLSPFVPMLFMGEEYGERAPFQFFSDHIDKEIADATREGRREEFAAFVQFAEELPDPQAFETFARSKLTRRRDRAISALYAQLLRARAALPSGDPGTIAFCEQSRWLRLRRGPFELICNFASAPVRLPSDGTCLALATDDSITLADQYVHLPALSGALIA
jgi:maltooligosyltrehalose trehalohydrolase